MAWLNRAIQRTIGLGILGLFLGGVAALAQAQVLKLNPSNLSGSKVPTNLSQGPIYFSCYDITTLKFLDCEVLVELRPLDPTFGGHIGHNLSNQLVGQLGDANGCCDRSVDGHTSGAFYPVKYIAPEASGQVQLYLTWTPPPNWVCADNIEGVLGSFHSPCIGIGHFDIGYPLQPLTPLDDISYLVVRQDERHPDPNGTSGTANTIRALKSVADEYSLLLTALAPGARLSINDMSLPRGGLFDFRTDWTVPHQTHRKGIHVDINRAPVDAGGAALAPIDCPDDYELQAAVDVVQAFLGKSLPSLVCESGGRKHIRF